VKFCECGCGQKLTNEKNRFINGHFGKLPKSQEHKKNIGKAFKGRIFTEEHKRKISKSKKGKKQSEEHKKKLSEVRKGKPTWNKGKKMSSEWKERVSKNFLGKKHTSEYKKKMRLYAIKRIEDQILNGEPLTPCIGEEERNFLNQSENILNLKIYRQFSICGYFVDGYIPELNLAFEFDEIKNHKNYKKDLQRQKQIEKELRCTFFRITDEEWKDKRQKILDQIRRIKML